MGRVRQQAAVSPAQTTPRPHWSAVVRALRDVRGVTQEGFAAQLGFSRRTIRRWEQGEAVPDAAAERALLAYCRDHALFRHFALGPLQGVSLTPESLRELLADARLGAATAAAAPQPIRLTLADSRVAPTNLPAALTSFIGREAELAALEDLFGSTRLLTLTGPGGVGKTRLALAMAAGARDQFRDGAFFVDLAPLPDAALLMPTIARVLGVRPSADVPVVESVQRFLREKQVLLLLDNFEHILEAAPEVALVLAAAPGLKVLATSRAPLHISGEQEFPVPPLALPAVARQSGPDGPPDYDPTADCRLPTAQPDAVRLFLARMRAVRPDFETTDEAVRLIAAICTQLEGLPLAIELAAARTKFVPLAALRDRLARRLPVLTDGPRDRPARQQTLRDTIAWSYDLLPVPEQALFRRLGVFVGGWDATSTAAVGDAAGDLGMDVLDGLASLVDQSLVLQHAGVDDDRRFTMLDTIREYALERLAASGEAEAAGRRHALAFLAVAEQADAELRGAGQAESLATLERELANLRAALEWSLAVEDADVALRLVAALAWFWGLRGHMREGRAWLERALRLAPSEATEPARGRALLGASGIALRRGDLDAALAHVSEAQSILRRGGDESGARQALAILGQVHEFRGDYPGARALFSEGLARARRSGDRWMEAEALALLGDVALREGDVPSAGELYTGGTTLFRRLGDTWMLAVRLINLGDAARWQGDVERAGALYEESLSLFRGVNQEQAPPNLYHNLGYVALHRREVPRAAALFAHALNLYDEWDDEHGIAECLVGSAGVAVAAGDGARAARFFGAADATFESLGRGVWPGNRQAYERNLAAARAGLGETAFAAAYAEGRTLTRDGAVVEARAFGAQWETTNRPPQAPAPRRRGRRRAPAPPPLPPTPGARGY
jgi:predicted ATPase/DNA-binding XRE family transcriptional regulator